MSGAMELVSEVSFNWNGGENAMESMEGKMGDECICHLGVFSIIQK